MKAHWIYGMVFIQAMVECVNYLNVRPVDALGIESCVYVVPVTIVDEVKMNLINLARW